MAFSLGAEYRLRMDAVVSPATSVGKLLHFSEFSMHQLDFFFSNPPKNGQLIRKSQVTCLFLHPYCFRTYGKFSPLIGVSSNLPHWYLRRDQYSSNCGRFTHILKTTIFCQVTGILEVLTSLSWWSLTTTKSYLPTCRWQLNNWLSH